MRVINSKKCSEGACRGSLWMPWSILPQRLAGVCMWSWKSRNQRPMCECGSACGEPALGAKQSQGQCLTVRLDKHNFPYAIESTFLGPQ